jgi:hypothetical protein
MPGFDGTGPQGLGPITGGGRGFCAVLLSPSSHIYTVKGVYPLSYGVPESTPYYRTRQGTAGAVPFASQMTCKQEFDFIKNQVQALRVQLEQIEARLQQLETET